MFQSAQILATASAGRAARHPTLPQNDTPAEQAKRAEQIAAASAKYVWDDNVPTLEGVPLAQSVDANETPTLEWFAILIGVGIKIVRNQIAVNLSHREDPDLADTVTATAAEDSQVSEQLDAIEATLNRVVAQHGKKRDASADIAEAVGDAAAASAEYDDHLAQLKGHFEALCQLVMRTGDVSPPTPSLDNYRALFDTLPVPGFAYQFMADEAFARMRVAGPNSVLIKGISVLPENFPVTADQYAAVVNGDTLETALADGRVYLSDYAELSVLKEGEWDGLPKYITQPMALFAVPPGGASLVPVAIQCDQDSGSNPIFTPSPRAEDSWGWEMAKLVVQVADGNYHELFVHLARTHLVTEAIAIATHRHLASVHPIWALLVPHFEGTLFINNQAANSLIAGNGPIDHIFAGTIDSSQQAAVQDRLAFDFYAHMPPAELAARNVNDAKKLPDYPYRDDALLVWQAIHDWATQYVRIYYADDAAVTGDTELTAWTNTLISEGKIKGFKPITSRAQLADVCAMIIFTASAQHAAVNFPQKDLMAFGPAISGAAWQPAPTDQAGHDKPDWLRAMLPLPLAMEQLNVLTLLGSVHYRPLGDYRSNHLPYPQWFRDPQIIGAGAALPRFKAALKQVEKQIVARNQQRKYPYPYLQPSLIPTSTNI
ncbi:MAG: lipoxygenase family protein [Pseudomonadota bacterium]